MKKVKKIILTFFVLAVFTVFFWAAASFRVYQAFSKEELFANITCQRSREPSFDYIIFYKPINQKEPFAYGIKGNQWRIDGLVIKWKGFVNLMGVHTWHKPVRLSGRFSNIEKQKKLGSTDYLLNAGEDNFWRFIYKANKLLPFIEAVYGSGAFVPCKENVVYNVYVTTSGYLIKPTSNQAK